MASSKTLRAMRVVPYEHVPASDLHLILEPKANDDRLISFGICHEVEGASHVASTSKGALAALAAIARGPPPGRKASPFDASQFVRAHFADTDELDVALLHRVKMITQGRVCVYVHATEATERQKLERAEFRPCGIATEGWHILTGLPDTEDDE